MPMSVSCSDNIAYRFVGNTVNEIGYHPYRFFYDAAYGAVVSAVLDMTPVPGLIESVAGAPGLDSTNTARLGAGITYATIKSLDAALQKTLACK